MDNDFEKFVHHSHEEKPIKLGDAFSYAFEGVQYAFKTQRNLKIHTVFAILAIAIALILDLPVAELAIIVICIFVVIALELVNTAIESVVDLVSPEWSELAKRAKDCAAGAVLLVSIMSLIVGCYIYISAILRMLG